MAARGARSGPDGQAPGSSSSSTPLLSHHDRRHQAELAPRGGRPADGGRAASVSPGHPGDGIGASPHPPRPGGGGPERRNSLTTAIRLYDDSESASNLWSLIGEGFKLRQEAEHRHATTIPPGLERSFPVLSVLLKLCGLLRSESGVFRNPLPWSLLMVVVNLVPYILSSVLPKCSVSCKYAAEADRCGLCTATLSDSAVNGYHTVAFSMLALLLSKNLAWTLQDTTAACKVQHEVDKLRLRYTLGSFAISIVWWALVPLIGLSFPGFVSLGDVVVGVSALIRAPFAATLSAAVLGSLTLIMATLTLEMKGIRAASKVGQTHGGDMLRKQLRYTATLHAAYHHANMLTQQAAVNIQVRTAPVRKIRRWPAPQPRAPRMAHRGADR